MNADEQNYYKVLTLEARLRAKEAENQVLVLKKQLAIERCKLREFQSMFSDISDRRNKNNK